MASKEAFITIKDHKENFETNPKYRLINPAKSELGKISKNILDDINSQIRDATGLKQWKNSLSVIDWFKNIKNKPSHTFLSFDIAEFYPSITEDLLNKAISWARKFVTISEKQIKIIKHARKSVLFNNGQTWIKQQDNKLFDVTMGSFDGAEVCELVGLFILNSLAIKYGKECVGLYRDDGLLLLRGTSARLADKARKDLHHIFDEFQLKITAEITYQSVNFLDITLNLHDESYYPYRKPNNDPLFIDSRSNHPPNITKQLPSSINKRISQLSSDQGAFLNSVPLYEAALQRSNYRTKFHYTPDDHPNNRSRTRNVIWFNPPFSKNVRTNVGRDFLNLIDKHFPKSNPLHKIFNRNSVKVSYSCMDNCKSVINKHNFSILSKIKNSSTQETKDNCNCRKINECPLNKNCLANNVVYKAEVKDNEGDIKEYVGMTSTTFKERYSNHKKSFEDPRYAKSTELSKHIWNLKNMKRSYNIKWTILKRSTSYRSGAKNCNLCLQEKLQILKRDKNKLLNKRCELFSKFRHRKRFVAGKFKSMHASELNITGRLPPMKHA